MSDAIEQGNRSLCAWLEASGLSNTALAARVTTATAGAGRPVRATATQVAAWREGRQPRAATAQAIADVLSSATGHPLRPIDLGFTSIAAHVPDPAASGPFGALEGAARLATERLNMDRRTLIKGGLVTGASAAAAVAWLLPDWIDHVTDAGRAEGAEVGAADAARLWDQARALLARDNAEGGRAVLPDALSLLNTVAIPMTRGRHADGQTRSAVLAAAAYSAHLAGWCSTDAGDLVSAQSLLNQGLDVAKEAGDPIVAAGILTDLSHLEHLVGSPRDGVLLAQAAQSPGPGSLPGAILARAAAMEARNHARMGDAAATHRAMGRAEEYLEHSTGMHEPHPLDFFFNIGQLHSELHPAVRDLVIAGVASPQTVFAHAQYIGTARHMGRRSAMINADGAIAHLINGDLDEGIKRADAAIAAAAPLEGGSGRVLGALQRVRPHLARYSAAPAARDLDARLRSAAPRLMAV